MELTAATTLTALWAVSSYYFWVRDKRTTRQPVEALQRSEENDAKGAADVLITYASQSGQARQLAERYASQVVASDCTFAARLDLRCMSELAVDDLAHYRQIFIIASTYGQGEAPDTAVKFSKTIASLQTNHFTTKPLQFAVLALGDRAYPRFCAFGHWLHDQFQRLGAHALSPCIEVDQLDKPALSNWQSLLEKNLNCQLTSSAEVSLYRLNDRRLLNPGSPNAGLFWLRLTAIKSISNDQHPQPGDLIDIELANGQRRTYSLANSPDLHAPTTIELIVRQHYRSDGTPGDGSSYLSERIDAASQIKLTTRRGFDWQHVPAGCPLILIGAGSGLAGVRAGLQARQQQQTGLNWLIFGERNSIYDRPCEDELLEWTKLGVLSRLDRVWSQDPGADNFRYAQDVLQARAAEVSAYLMQGGYIYVCGSASGLGRGVDDALMHLLGEPLVARLREQGRYIRDIY